MIKIFDVDSSGKTPYPEAHNPMLSRLRGLKTVGGSSLEGSFPDIKLILTDGAEAPRGLVDYFKVGLLNVISIKLKCVFESVDAEFEYYPISVFYNDAVSDSYFVAHPLKRFMAVDKDQSDMVYDEELRVAKKVNKLVLDETKFEGVEVAMIAEIQRLGINENLASAIESSGCVGCTLVNPADIRY